MPTISRPSSSSPKKVYTFFCWGGFAPPDPPFKSAAVAASASQVRTLKPSRPLSRPPGVGSTWTWTGPGPGREALGPGQGLAGRPWRPGRHTFLFLTNKNKLDFLFSEGGRLPPSENKKSPAFLLFGGGQIPDRHFWLRQKCRSGI